MNSLNEQFGDIYDQYIDKIYRFVYLKVSSQEIAQDITSKVFLKAWEKYEKSTPSSDGVPGRMTGQIQNISAFLYQIARNAVVDHYREKARDKTISVDASPQIADPGQSSYDKAVLSADISVIKKAIKKLKPDHQDIIIWHYLEDMPIDNIAELMGKPAGTIRVALHRGLKELKDIIQEV